MKFDIISDLERSCRHVLGQYRSRMCIQFQYIRVGICQHASTLIQKKPIKCSNGQDFSVPVMNSNSIRL